MNHELPVPITSREFAQKKIAAKVHTDEVLLSGLQHVELREYQDYLRAQLVHQLTAFVLTEPAGDAATDYVRADLPVRPRWLPRFLWRRIPTRRVEWTLRATPEWSYPHATIAFPRMGEPVRVLSAQPVAPDGSTEWRDT